MKRIRWTRRKALVTAAAATLPCPLAPHPALSGPCDRPTRRRSAGGRWWWRRTDMPQIAWLAAWGVVPGERLRRRCGTERGSPSTAWTSAPCASPSWLTSGGKGRRTFGTGCFTRACISLNGLGADLAADAPYPICWFDPRFGPLNGRDTCRVRFPAGRGVLIAHPLRAGPVPGRRPAEPVRARWRRPAGRRGRRHRDRHRRRTTGAPRPVVRTPGRRPVGW